MKKLLSISLIMVMLVVTLVIPMSVSAKTVSPFNFLDSLKPVASGRYTGNMGDSYLKPIKKTKKDLKGKTYSHGMEAWVARWNYTDEKSWTYNVYNINKNYKVLKGNMVLLESYNTTDFKTSVYFYGDGKFLKKYTMTPNKCIFNVSVALGNVKSLKILFKDNTSVSGGTSFGLVNCKLYRSLPPKTPQLTNVKKSTGVIKGTTTANVYVFAKMNKKTYKVKADNKGNFTLNTTKIKNGTELKLWSKNSYGQVSKTKDIEVW